GKEDIDRMIREAEEHAAEDKVRREAAELRNNAEQLVFSTEKILTENSDKLPEDVKTEIQADVDGLKSALAGEDDDAVNSAFEKLSQSQSKIGEALYQQSETASATAADSSTGEPAAADDEDIVDAEVVDDEPEGGKK
ncbi:MAG: Hsp70 family protein, partial [Microbacteriaceae bacterium]|nr:Hsp70 family protein [Microbacteriaceae bacterium]